MSIRELRLTGSGGQGLVLAGIILAEAALLDGNSAIQTQSYGPEARGGASKSEVMIANEEIHYPKVDVPDILLILTDEASKRYANSIKPGGVVIYDADVKIEKNEGVEYLSAPIVHSAFEVVKKPFVTNMIALGVLVSKTKVVSFESLKKAVLARVPKGTEDINMKALEIGSDFVSN